VPIPLHELGIDLIGESNLESRFLKAQIQESGTGKKEKTASLEP
jgi:hypothetical protein